MFTWQVPLGPGIPYIAERVAAPSDEKEIQTVPDVDDRDFAGELMTKLEKLRPSTPKVDLSPSECTVANFARAVATCTGLHYSGQGTIKRNKPALRLADGDLSFGDFPELGGSPWMFLNACEIGHIGRHGSIETAKVLLRRGAKCVIAPFLAIRDIEATDYSQMYDGLHLVIPFGLNFHRLRFSAFLTRGATSIGHMAYVTYGDPSTRRRAEKSGNCNRL